MIYILIALVASGFMFQYYLLKKIKTLEKQMIRQQTALQAHGRDADSFQMEMSRKLQAQTKEMEISTTRIYKSVDVVRRDIISSLPTKIRKVIGHIEFSSRA